jgi:hypothetical protein
VDASSLVFVQWREITFCLDYLGVVLLFAEAKRSGVGLEQWKAPLLSPRRLTAAPREQSGASRQAGLQRPQVLSLTSPCAYVELENFFFVYLGRSRFDEGRIVASFQNLVRVYSFED